MNHSLALLIFALGLFMFSALVSLCLPKLEALAIRLSGSLTAIAGVVAIVAIWPVLIHAQVVSAQWAGPFAEFAHLTVRLDALAAFMVLVISLLATISAIYSIGYLQHYRGRGAWALGFFMNIFIASMIALVVVDNAFYFIVLFEAMSLSSYFLVIGEQDESSVSAGFLYFLIAHAGSVLIMLSFFLMYRGTGSLDFASFRQFHPGALQGSIIFLLAFFGFGAKAGMLPLHGWLPRAHPAAPSHASAMMSGVMVKIGIFGIIKVGIDLLGAQQAWWGVVVLAFGAVSSVLGVLYALAEHDIKRLLAYHTVENIGIILMGVGAGMIGMATHHPLLALIGLLGALYHTINHAVFKGLLFLGAGAVIEQVHTKNMEKMGGLAKRMPHTALAFLIGCMAIAALPPLNGFVSEWFTYQSLFSLALHHHMWLQLAGAIGIILLAITGALAAMCFVKVYGVSFCGRAKSEAAQNAHEEALSMRIAMGLLALLCIVLGLGAWKIAPVLTAVAAQLVHSSSTTIAAGSLAVMPGSHALTALNAPLLFVLLLALPLLPLIIASVLRQGRLGFRRRGDPWACGYGYEQEMAISAGGFAQPLRVFFSGLYQLRQTLDPSPILHRCLNAAQRGAAFIEPSFDNYLVMPVVRGTQRLSRVVQWIQFGDFRAYCLYVVAALLILLFAVML
ncbi:hydrogenase 4 subunit B [Celerinatantimonas diazotrophica]|uniref:Hydrogenase-4 component B n=1 Tax=Celerinatantimonas diazotrophica TaxID=412034 RepID=A0A4R1KAN8_9GAMM|nr:hydrogenase 4 subunit B [Celerinatantimonas diazotrophica]TCK61110.1 hydrogenase-4 component B [Celerinatantimonas diazotrophica]CAG9295159.1 Hydrogenase-4 component B [Celerinatantimonas diazotrophica]